jgi:hypothetical protein
MVRPLRRCEFNRAVRCVARFACAAQECQHGLELGIGFAAAKLFGGLQPDDFRVCFHEGADFLNALALKRHQPHEFYRMP